MKRSLSSLITDTNVREYKVREINVPKILVRAILRQEQHSTKIN